MLADRKTRKESTQKAKGNLYSLMALIAMKQGNHSEAAQLVKKALSFAKDPETLSNAGDYYHHQKDFEQAFKSYYTISAGHAEDSAALTKMKMNYIAWKHNDSGLNVHLQKLKNQWNEEMKIELQKQILHVQSPDFINNIVDLEGKNVSQNMLKNKIVIIDFWATWCIPCMHEMPYLQKVYEKYKNDSNVIFMVINSGAKNTLDDAKGWWGNKKFSFPVYYNTDHDIGDKLGFNLIPATYIIDQHNYIRFKTAGFEGPVIERKIAASIELLQNANN